MRSVIARLSLGFSLIALTAVLLLASDWHQRRPAAQRIPQVAILLLSSTPVLVEGLEGALETLRENGFIDGQNIALRQYNAEGDMATLNAIAHQVTDGQFDMVMTFSTPAMQAVAKANTQGKAIHVFGLVADPFAAGVGLRRDAPLDHPRHFVGTGIPLPVDQAFQLARKMFPRLKTVGVAWNPAESNSVGFVGQARKAAQELQIELLEAHVDNTSAVLEAASSLASRGAEALWVPGDNTILSALNSVLSAAKKARIPVFGISPGDPERGTILDLGADFHEIGKLTGKLAVDIIRGADPAQIPVRDFSPRRLVVNQLAVNGLKDPWRIPDDIAASADILVDKTGVRAKTTPRQAADNSQAPLAKKWKVRIIEYNNVQDVEESEDGVRAGLRESGLKEGRDYTVDVRNAQGDMATVNSLVDGAITEGADLLITLSTPTLQAALKRAAGKPIVFTYLANAVAAGAGRSDEDHRPNVTGVYNTAAYAEMLELIRQVRPDARTLGTLFVPAEVNMVYHREQLNEAARKLNFKVVALAANTSADVADAALALTSQRIDVICQLPGNLTAAAFPSIAAAANKAKLPIFAFQSTQARYGAAVVLARDYGDAGREAGLLAARVMRGENPGKIPFTPYSKTKLIVNTKAARHIGLTIPPALVKKAEEVISQ
ncbi:MAG TPA: ABC transporter substrate-binding protein [Candidatus Polarisedimenticolaceae bacterium]|nr:ABC transporter substrate-binding protein [Candidatus Polarisedimenticolaceae bacterium]